MQRLFEIGPVVLKESVNFENVFMLFHHYFSLEKGVASSFEQSRIPFPKGRIFQVWLRSFLKVVNVYSVFRYYIPLK